MRGKLGRRLKPLIPVPKVMVPTVAGLVTMAAAWVATGDFDRLELAMLVQSGGWAAIGWSTPEASRTTR